MGIFQNLIDNAIKFTEPTRTPRIRIGSFIKDGVDVCYVEDNGVGVEEKYYEQIFRIFEQLDPAATGTGVGLALVKRIIEGYDGRIWVEPAVSGSGTRFRFTLPSRNSRTKE